MNFAILLIFYLVEDMVVKQCRFFFLQRMDRSGTGSRRRGTPSVSISQRLRLTDHHHVGPIDALSNASLMEVRSIKFTSTFLIAANSFST